MRSPSNGLLIADEVGLGKTIEAGLIWTELKARENAKAKARGMTTATAKGKMKAKGKRKAGGKSERSK